MTSLLLLLLLLLPLGGCGDAATPPAGVDGAATQEHDAVGRQDAAHPPGARATGALPADESAASPPGRDLLAAAPGASPLDLGKLTEDLVALGAAALPALQDSLRAESVVERRVAAMALLQLGRVAEPAAPALLAARNDPDPSVRATAHFAWLQATGDTSDLESLRQADEAARNRDR